MLRQTLTIAKRGKLRHTEVVPRPRGKIISRRWYRRLLERNLSAGHGPVMDAEVADQSGVSPSMLSELLAGTVGASDRTVASLCAAIGCEPGDLFPECDGYGPPPRKDSRTAVAS